MNKKVLLVSLLLLLSIIPVAVNVAITMPANISISNHISNVLVSRAEILGGGEEIDTPADPA